MKKLCLFLAITALPLAGFSQFLGDSVIIYVDHRVEINMAVSDYAQLKSSEKVLSALEAFLKLLPAIQDQLSEDSPESITYSVGSSLSVEPGDPKIIYLLKEGELSDTGFRDQAIIEGEGFRITITTTDLSKITELSLIDCLKNVSAALPQKRHWSKSLYYECIEGKVNELSTKNNEFDFLELNFGAGAGLVKNNWVPDVTMGVGIGFNKKGNVRFPYVSSNMLFDFSEAGKTHLNTFMNVGYGWNISKEDKRNNLLKVELGYLISKQGNLFGENTFRVGMNWSPLKGVFVSPHLYITDNFKTVYPGIRIGFGF